MTILKKIFEELSDKNDDVTTKVRKICDQIFEEEKEKLQHPDLVIKGARIFLCLETKGKMKNDLGFLTLEREDEELYIIAYYIRMNPHSTPKKQKVWEITENKPEKIIARYAAKLKFLRGE